MNTKMMSALLVLVASVAGPISPATAAIHDIPSWPPPYVDDWPVKQVTAYKPDICNDPTILYFRMPDECLLYPLESKVSLVETDEFVEGRNKPAHGNIKLPVLAALEAPKSCRSPT